MPRTKSFLNELKQGLSIFSYSKNSQVIQYYVYCPAYGGWMPQLQFVSTHTLQGVIFIKELQTITHQSGYRIQGTRNGISIGVSQGIFDGSLELYGNWNK